MNLAANLAATAARLPDAIAVKIDDEEWTYARLADAAARFTAHLRSTGIRPGDRIALSLPSVPAFPIVYYGALAAGAIVMPLNPLFKPREVTYYLEDAGASLLVCLPDSDAETSARALGVDVVTADAFPGLLAACEPDTRIEDRDERDTAVLLYTSGLAVEKISTMTEMALSSSSVYVPSFV